MLHIIRLNVAGHGYSLYSIESDSVPERLRGGTVPSPWAPAYEAVAARLGDFLARHGGSSLAASCDADRHLVFGYALHLPARDEHGRQGLTLLHAVREREASQLPALVMAALSQFSGTRLGELTRALEEVARGATPPETLLKSVAIRLDLPAVREESPISAGNGLRPRLASVLHDCGGAPALAWVTLADQQVGVAGPWEIFDRGGKGGQTATVVEPCGDGTEVLASDLLRTRGIESSKAIPRLGSFERSNSTPVERPAELAEADRTRTPGVGGQAHLQHPWRTPTTVALFSLVLILAALSLVLAQNPARSAETFKTLPRLELLRDQPNTKYCDRDEDRGRVVGQLSGRQVRLFVCGPQGWTPVVAK